MKTFMKPQNLNELLKYIDEQKENYVFIAGGTDVVSAIKKGLEKREHFIDLSCLKSSLSYIKNEKNSVIIGGMTTFNQIQESAIIKEFIPDLIYAAKTIGGYTIQNMATIAGNIAKASPAADSIPVLLVYNAIIRVQSAKEIRQIPITEFYKSYKKFDLSQNEIIIAIEIPKVAIKKHSYAEVGARDAVFISKVSFAYLLTDKGISLAAGSVYQYPTRLKEVEKNFFIENLTKQQFESFLNCDITPMNDIRSTGKYRFKVLLNLVYDLYKRINTIVAQMK